MIELFLIKAIITIVLVVGLSVIAEKISPKIAGILAGYPTATAISLFFFGLEISPQFAVQSVPYNLLGLITTQVFCYLYFVSTSAFKTKRVFYSAAIALVGYFVAAYLFSFLRIDMFGAFLIAMISTVFFTYLFRQIKETKIGKIMALDNKALLVRALIAAAILLTITEAAKHLPPTLAGLFSAFPSTVFPLLIIIHINYKNEHVNSIIKNIIKGNIALVFYSLAVGLTYSVYGVYIGTAIALATATIVVFAISKLK